MSDAGNESDIGQRRIPAADLGRVQEDLAEIVGVLDVAHAVRVGDGGEIRADTVIAVMRDRLQCLLGTVPGVGQEGVRLGRRARLARDDDERPKRVEVIERGRHVRRVGRVEDAQREVALDRAERPVEEVRGETAAAHAGNDRGRETLLDGGVAERLEADGAVGKVRRRIDPAEPPGDRLADPWVGRPERHVTVEQTGRPLLVASALDGRVERGGAIAEGKTGCGQRGRGWVGHERGPSGDGCPMVRRKGLSGLGPMRAAHVNCLARRPPWRAPWRGAVCGAARR